SVRKARITRIDESRRRVDEHVALDALVEVLLVEDHDRVVVDLLAEVRLPAEAAVDRHTARRAPAVLRIRSEIPVVDIENVRTSDFEPRHTAHDQGRHGKSERAAVTRPTSASPRSRQRLEVPAAHVGAEPELMTSVDPAQII